MSRYRQIHCLIWNDDKFPFVKDDTKLVFFHILTTPLSTPFGLYKASIEALAAEMRWPIGRYRDAIEDAIRHGFVKYDPKHLVIMIPHFLEYNLPNGPNQVKSWSKVFTEIPDTILKNEFIRIVNAIADGMTDAMRDAMRDAFEMPCPIQEQEQEQEQEQRKKSTRVPTQPKKFIPPTIDDITKYCVENDYPPELGKKVWLYYDAAGWQDARGHQVKNWKQKMLAVWFKPENKSDTGKNNGDWLKQRQHEEDKKIAISILRTDGPEEYEAFCEKNGIEINRELMEAAK